MRHASRGVLSNLKAITTPCCRCAVTTATQTADHDHDVINSNGRNNLTDIPGPTGIYALSYIGLRFQFKPFSKYDLRKFSTKMEAWKNEYGPIVRAKVGNKWSLYLFDPDDIEKVFRADQKYPERATLPILTVYEKRQKIPPSLANTNGIDWYKMRAPTQKVMLRPRAVTKYAPKLSKIADDFVLALKNKGRLDNLPFKLMEYSAEGVGMLCFNTRLGCITPDNTVTPLMEYTKDYLDRLGNHYYKVIPTYMFYRTKYYLKFEEAADYLYRPLCNKVRGDVLVQVVCQSVCRHNDVPDNPPQLLRGFQRTSTADKHINRTLKDIQRASDDDVEYENNLLSDLLSNPGLTVQQVRRTITDVFIGGIDSTANTMTFLLFQLAKNQDKQDLLFKDLVEHVPKMGEIQEDTINKMPYLKACLKESFRMVFPIAGGTLRILDKDITLQGYNVPKGTPMQLCSGIICRDENYFPQQDKFLPERWIRGDTRTDVNPFAHLPFGFGPRKCIGQRFAEQEIYICTAKLLRNYRVKLPPGVTDIPFIYSIFSTPTEPVSFLLEKRQD